MSLDVVLRSESGRSFPRALHSVIAGGISRGVARSADEDVLREMIGFAFQQAMKLSIIGMTVEANGEKSPKSLAQRDSLPRT